MECPKCHHIQGDALECESCGVVFAKYEEYLAKTREQRYEKLEKKSVRTISMLLLVVAMVSVAIYFVVSEQELTDERLSVVLADEDVVVQPPQDRDKQTNNESISASLSALYSPRNNIELADISTVFIKTAWGTGSGFFIDKQCHVITNRHVVEVDRQKIDEMEGTAETLKSIIDNETKRLKDMYFDIYRAQTEAESKRRQQLHDDYEQNIADKKDTYEELLSAINELDGSSLFASAQVILKDGRTYESYSSEVSDDADLALLRINAEDCPYLKINNADDLALGTKVYTIGNPHGLQHTVTSGIVSGYQEYDNNNYIQTDAPINPGNSGGPLIDTDGRIVGINTMILAKAEGIGFAIPVNSVFETFPQLSR